MKIKKKNSKPLNDNRVRQQYLFGTIFHNSVFLTDN